MLDIAKFAKEHNLSIDDLVFYPLPEASEITGINRNTLAKWSQTGLPHIQAGRNHPVYVRIEDVEAYEPNPVGRAEKLHGPEAL